MAEFTEIINALAECVGREHLKTEEDVLSLYRVDGLLPKAVAFPHNTDQVSGLMKIACREGWAVIPWGAGTKIATGNPPQRLDLVISTKRMNHMRDVDVANLTLTVEAGVRFRDIQARLATQEDRCYLPLEDLVTESGEVICSERSHSGCFFPLDPPFSENATIGGVMAADSSGPKRLYYNLPRDLVLGAKVVAADGSVVGTGGKTVKNVSGYDISKLMLGTHGSLGVVCEMTLRLLPLPESMATVVFSFADFESASAFADAVLNTTMLPAAVEVMNAAAFNALEGEDLPGLREDGFAVAAAFEHFKTAVDRMKEKFSETAKAHGATGERLIGEDHHALFWLKVGDIMPVGAESDAGYVSIKLNYPIAAWKETVKTALEGFEKQGFSPRLLVHSGSGVCLVSTDIGSDGGKVSGIVKDLLASCRRAGGNLVVQYAPTGLKKDLPIWGEAGSDFVVMKRLKERLDPKGTMCPGRYVGGL
ncbi:MAG TPA: FAD-binding oxidoreductase [Desulfobacteraceae bacterium]|nr:FAD-binding oxidoreductase [Desulfobacteraceae bacterium]